LSSTLSAAGAVGASSDAVDQILQSAYNAQYLQASVQLDALEALMDPDNGVCCGKRAGSRGVLRYTVLWTNTVCH
jgi:hypothetical protein